MLIRSQDKTCIVNMGNIDTICYSESERSINVFNTESIVRMGKYSTEEKAIKVLDMLEEEYKKPKLYADISENEVEVYENKVFHMPSEEELDKK